MMIKLHLARKDRIRKIGTKLGTALLIIFTLSLTLTRHASSQERMPERLEVEVSKSGVEMRLDQAGLTPSQAMALRQYFERRVQNNSFVAYGGRLNFNVTGELLRQLRVELAQVDPGNTEQVEQAINRSISQYDPAPWAEDFDDAQIVIGRPIQISENEPHKLLIVIGAEGSISGSLDNAMVIGSRINFTEGSRIHRSLVTIGSQVNVSPASLTEAQRLDIVFPYDSKAWMESLPSMGGQALQREFNWRAWPAYFYGSIVSLLLAFVFGALYLTLFPQFHRQTGNWLLERKSLALGIGFLGYMSFFILSLLLVVSILGILLIPSLLFFFIILSAIGYFAVASMIGHAVLQKQQLHDLWRFSLGLVSLQILGLIPWFGWLIVQIMAMAGFGAVLHTIYMRFRPKRTDITRSPEPWHRPTFRPKRWKMPSSAK